MFTVDDLWKFFQVLNDEVVTDLSDATISLIKSEQAVTTTFFENIIDQAAYNSNDYHRLRSFIIDWYTSLKTIVSTQKEISADLFSLPDFQLDELFRSFGFDYSTYLTFGDGIQLNANKVNLFFDLVNLYKIKGTPESIIRVLQYYGINIKLYELWLKKKSETKLDFELEAVNDGPPISNISYDSIVKDDPHWMMTEDQILELNESNKIKLPSKSPYFTIVPSFTQDINIGISILQRIVQDQYDTWDSGGTPTQDCTIAVFGETVSILESYLSCIYVFNDMYDAGYSSAADKDFLCYDGSTVVIADIISEYNTIVSNPTSRADRESKLIQYYDKFTRKRSENFLLDKNTAGQKLELINPTLKAEIDTLYNNALTDKVNLLTSLLIDVGDWVNDHIGLEFLNISYIVLGFVALASSLGNVINFFKPIRARWLTIEAMNFDNKLTESIRIDDLFGDTDIEETFVDYDTANSHPCCDDPILLCPDSTASYYSRDTYDCGSYYDIGAAWDLDGPEVGTEDSIYDIVMCLSDSTSVVSSGIYDSTADIDIVNDIKIAAGLDEDADISSVYWQSGGFDSFDEGGTFDCTTGYDNFEVLVQESSAVGVKQVLFGGNNSKTHATITRYQRPLGGDYWSASEADSQEKFTSNGILSDFAIKLLTAPGVGKSYTFSVRVNGVDTGIEVTISDDQTSASDSTSTYEISVGDLVSYMEVPTNVPATSYTFQTITFTSLENNESVVPGGFGRSTNLPTDSTNVQFNYICSGYIWDDDEDLRSQLNAGSGTLKNLYVDIENAPGVGSGYEFIVRLNGVDTLLSCTISDLETESSNLINDITISPGDSLSIKCQPIGTPNSSSDVHWGTTFISDTLGESIVLSGNQDDITTAITTYAELITTYGSWVSNIDTRTQLGNECVLRDFYAKLSGAPGVGKSYDFHLMLNSSPSLVTCQISDLNTIANDIVNEQIVGNGDYLSIRSSPTGSPTSRKLMWGFVQYNDPVYYF